MADSDAEGSARTCFVAMPITTSDAYAEMVGGDRDHFKHVFAHLFKPALQAAGLKVIPPSASGSEMIQGGIIRNLEQADFVLCDLSDLNPNVFFELGIRTSLDRPVMHVRDNLTSRIPFDIAAINTHTYNGSLTPWQLEAEIPRLAAFITEVIDSEKPGNEMWHYFGLTKRGEPAAAGDDPTQAKLDLILRELAKPSPAQSDSVDIILSTASIAQTTTNTASLRELVDAFLRARNIGNYRVSRLKQIGDRRTMEVILPRARPPMRGEERSVLRSMLDEAGFDHIDIEFRHDG